MLTIQTLYLEFDEEPQDKYGRTLAYVWLDHQVDSTNIEDIAKNMYNAKLIADGYAIAKNFPPNTKYAEIFEELQNR
ncbi:MAG: thermonuclease family protein [Turicibacter sp.]|nr:thermonuclease family protein [Turicibacter sp.]